MRININRQTTASHIKIYMQYIWKQWETPFKNTKRAYHEGLKSLWGLALIEHLQLMINGQNSIQPA